MVNIFRAVEEVEGELAATDFARPSSPWESRVVEHAEYMLDYDYEAYFSQISNVNLIRSPSPDPFSVPSLPLWDFRDTPIPIPPSPCHVRLISPTVATVGPFFPSNSIIILVNGTLNSLFQFNAMVILILIQSQSLVSDCVSILNVFASNGYTEALRFPSSYQPKFIKLLPKICYLLHLIVSLRVFIWRTSRNSSLIPVSSASTSRIANLNGCNQQNSSRKMSELTEQSQFLDNSQVSFMHVTPMQHMPAEFVREDSLFCPPQPEQLTKDTVLHMNHTFPPESTRQGEVATRGIEIIDNIPKCDSFQSPVEGEVINIDELTEQSRFLHNSQLSVVHETPMDHMPECVQEDSVFCPPQFEQLTTDTALHMNHTFPPESTRQGEVATRGTEIIDNIPKCDSFQSPVEGEAINIDEGDFRSASQTVNASGNLLERNKRKISRSIEMEDLRPFLGKTTRAEAAKSLDISVSTVKRICRANGILDWRKINKDECSPSELKGANETGASIQSSLTMPFRDALPSKPPVQAPVQNFQSDTPFSPPPRELLSTVTAAQTSPPERRMQDANFVTIKATYDGPNTIIKFDLPSSATMVDLEGKVAKKLKLKVGSFTIKYHDQEGEWISVTDCDDLQYCIRTLRSSATIRMLVQSTTSGPT